MLTRLPLSHSQRGASSEAFVPLIDHAFADMELALVYAQRPDDDHARIIDSPIPMRLTVSVLPVSTILLPATLCSADSL